MNIKWPGSVLLCVMIVSLYACPSTARLSEGSFVPFSEVVKTIADRKAKLHRIEKGDTLSGIARTYKVSLEDLMKMNNMNEKTILQIGSTVRVPVVQRAVHIVAPGDTMFNLAERYQVSSKALIAANQERNINRLEVGDCLHIPAVKGNEWLELRSSEPSRGVSNSLLWPIRGTITSHFGNRKSGFHHGLDIANDMGTPIQAAAAGTVSFCGQKSVYGRTVIIDHPDGKQTLYAHAKKTYVNQGERVQAGQKIAEVGVSGYTTGPHLHFEVRINNKAYDPLNYLR